MSWIGVDLDGTLAMNPTMAEHQQGVTIGRPVPQMMARVRQWLAEGRDVRIFTARACDPAEIPGIEAWLEQHGLKGLPVTNAKDFGLAQIWDDKAIRVQRNTGDIL